MHTQNPITGGYRVVMRDPRLLLMEVAWRWWFGLAAGVLLIAGWKLALGTVRVSRVDVHGLQSHDAFLMAQSALHVLMELSGPLAKLAAIVLPAVSLLWIVMSAMGRTFTMRRLVRDGRTIRFRSILALQFLRTLFTWLVLAAMAAAVLVASQVANRGPQPDYVMYYALALPMLAVAALFWTIVNWYLSTAVVWVGRDCAGAAMALRMAMGFASAHRGDMAGLNVVFTLVRLVALVAAFVLCVLPGSLAADAPVGYTTWVAAISLLYFVIADFIYVARLASYLMLQAP